MTLPAKFEIPWLLGEGHEWVPGCIFYGFYRDVPKIHDSMIRELLPPGCLETWPTRYWLDRGTMSIECRFVGDVPDWKQFIELSLRHLLASGAIAGWMGDESSNPSVDSLNSLSHCGGNVLCAAVAPDTMVWNLDMNNEPDYLRPEQLESLWRAIPPAEVTGEQRLRNIDP